MRRLSIKWRVTLWYTGFFAGLTALVLLFIYLNATRMTTASIQRNLVDAVTEAIDEIQYDGGKLEVDDDVEDLDGVSILVYDRNGELFYGRRPSGFAAPIQSGLLQVISVDDYQWYVYDLSVEVGGYGDVVVRGIASSAAAQVAGSSILRLELLTFPLLILAAGAGGYLLTRRAFLPVKRISDTASSISGGGDLSKRLAMTGVRDEIYSLAATFDDMFARLEQSFANEQRFTSDASHELRTPVAVIASQCEYALSPAATDSDRKAALQVVLEQARDMSALIGQLLSLSRMDAGCQPMDWEVVDVAFLLEAIVDEMEEMARGRKITFHTAIQPGLLIRGDQTLLTRMLMNLVSNAVKYGNSPGDVWITAKREGGGLFCEIRDNGPGIPPEHLDRIWERFYRVDPSRNRQGSYGLGLPMARWIAQAHGGTVEVWSRPGQGSAFTVRLPLAKETDRQ